MKTFILLFSITFVCSISFAQKKAFEDPIYADFSKSKNSTVSDIEEINNFSIENRSVVYVKVFEINDCDSITIIEKLNSYLPTISGLSLVEFNGNVFTGKIEHLMVDYGKYGGKILRVWVALNNPMYANLTIQIKDFKYRVIISDMEFVHSSMVFDMNSMATNKERTSFIDKKVLLQAMEYIDLYMTDKFTISNEKITDDW
jgi:hypothetical protein